MKKILFLLFLNLNLIGLYAQNIFPYKWDLYPCYEDVIHSLQVNNHLLEYSGNRANIGDTVIYEIDFPKDVNNEYEYQVMYEVFSQAGLDPPVCKARGVTDYSHVIKIPFIITPEIHAFWLSGQVGAKIFIEVKNFQFKDELGNTGSMHSEGFVKPCCKTLFFFIDNTNITTRK